MKQLRHAVSNSLWSITCRRLSTSRPTNSHKINHLTSQRFSDYHLPRQFDDKWRPN